MARKTTELVKQAVNEVAATEISDTLPDYLKGHAAVGLEALGHDDFKQPRILLLQSNSPQVKAYPGRAIPGEFWHNTANVSLGSEFRAIALIANKRAILWKPRWDGGGMIAFSENAIDWGMGANTKHTIHPVKGGVETVTWDTKANVRASGLLEWGSYNPNIDGSQPAASLVYEYLFHLYDYPHIIPSVYGVYKTSIAAAKQFNAGLLATQAPIHSICAIVRADEKKNNDGEWFTPTFETAGFVPKEIYDKCCELKTKYAKYQTEYEQEDDSNVAAVPQNTNF